MFEELQELDRTAVLSVAAAVTAGYALLVRILRYRRRNTLEHHFAHLLNKDGSVKHGKDAPQMNPLDAQKIVWYLGRYEFPWSLNKACEFALFKTYGIHTIAKLLVETTELSSSKTATKRAEDTAILIQEYVNAPLDSERARVAIARMNYLHRRWGDKISREDMLYTMGALALEPIIWFEKWEWRTCTPLEKHAVFVFWREIGWRMGIPAAIMPDSFEELLAWYNDYEAKNLYFTPPSKELAASTIRAMLESVRFVSVRPTARKAVISLMDDSLREAMGLEKVNPMYRKVADALLAFRATLLRHFFLPRFNAKAQSVSVNRNAQGRYYRNSYNFAPYYIPRTFGNLLEGWLVTGLIPGKSFIDKGYIVEEDLGPESARGKGIDIVHAEAERFESADKGVSVGCPFRF